MSWASATGSYDPLETAAIRSSPGTRLNLPQAGFVVRLFTLTSAKLRLGVRRRLKRRSVDLLPTGRAGFLLGNLSVALGDPLDRSPARRLRFAVMRSPKRRRLASLVVAVVLLGATSAIPLHSDADHAADQPHVEQAHGGHDAILIQDADDGAVGGKVVLRPAPAAQLCLELPGATADVPTDLAEDPPSRPPDYSSPPRAPPALT